jgi:hypothetical protein
MYHNTSSVLFKVKVNENLQNNLEAHSVFIFFEFTTVFEII